MRYNKDNSKQNEEDNNEVKSTDSKFIEKMLGGNKKCVNCKKFPCKWLDYAGEAHQYFFEVGGAPGGIAPPFVSTIQAKHRYTLYGRMHAIRTNCAEMTLPPGKRFQFPKCVEDQVKLLFPDPTNTYTGFKDKPNKK